jgi:hypothetical protein
MCRTTMTHACWTHPFHSALIRDKYQVKCVAANYYLFQVKTQKSELHSANLLQLKY